MKKLTFLRVYLILLTGLMTSVAGCKTTPGNPLVGTWGWSDGVDAFTLTFNSDMSCSGTMNSVPSGTGTYTVDTDASIVIVTISGTPSTYGYALSSNNDTLTLTQSGSSTIVATRQ